MATAAEPITPEAVTGAKHISDVAPDIKGAAPRDLSKGNTGIPLVDQGAVCDGGPGPGCFLTDRKRDNLIKLVMGRIQAAGENCSLAIERQRVTELLKKDDDLSWIALMILDVVGFHVVSALTQGAKALRAGALTKLEGLGNQLALQFEEMPKLAQAARDGLQALDPDSFKSGVKYIIDKAKKGASKVSFAPTDKERNVAYLDALQTNTGTGFQYLRESLPAALNDVQLLSAFDSFDNERHSVAAYESSLKEKLSRFNASGVNEIGRKLTDGPPGAGGAVQTLRDTRVVWVQHQGVIELRYQRHDSGYNPRSVPDGLTGWKYDRPPVFGQAGDSDEDPEFGARVPPEFAGAAIVRHKQVWGEDPPVIKVFTPQDPVQEYLWNPPQKHGGTAKTPPAGAASRPGVPSDANKGSAPAPAGVGPAIGSTSNAPPARSPAKPADPPLVKTGDPADVFLVNP